VVTVIKEFQTKTRIDMPAYKFQSNICNSKTYDESTKKSKKLKSPKKK
jgi:hypothetical protein